MEILLEKITSYLKEHDSKEILLARIEEIKHCLIEINNLINKQEINALSLINSLKKVSSLTETDINNLKDMCYIVHIEKGYSIGDGVIEKGRNNCFEIVNKLETEVTKLEQEAIFYTKVKVLNKHIENKDAIENEDIKVIKELLTDISNQELVNVSIDVYKNNCDNYLLLTKYQDIDYLKEYMSNSEYKKLESKCSKEVRQELFLNKEKVINVISYLKGLGVKKIGLLISADPNFFVKEMAEVEERISKYNLKNIVTLLNFDPNTIKTI